MTVISQAICFKIHLNIIIAPSLWFLISLQLSGFEVLQNFIVTFFRYVPLYIFLRRSTDV